MPPRKAFAVNAASYVARLLWLARTSASCTPISAKMSIAREKLMARATRPKSAGTRMRASTSVLRKPRARVAARQPMVQPAPLAVFSSRAPVRSGSVVGASGGPIVIAASLRGCFSATALVRRCPYRLANARRSFYVHQRSHARESVGGWRSEADTCHRPLRPWTCCDWHAGQPLERLCILGEVPGEPSPIVGSQSWDFARDHPLRIGTEVAR